MNIIVEKLGEGYRFGQRDVDAGWEIMCRYFGSKEGAVSEPEWHLALYCLKAEDMHKLTRKWPTAAEVDATFAREDDERAAFRKKLQREYEERKAARTACR